MTRIAALLWWGCLLLLVLRAEAQERYTLDRALETALSRNPQLLAAEAQVEAARGSLRQAGAGPNPVLSLETEVENFERVEAVGLSLSQEFELGGKRSARIRVAEAEIQEAELAAAETRRELEADIKAGFLEVLFFQELERLRQAGHELAERQAELGRKRLALGDIAGVEVIQLESDAERRRVSLEQARGERQARAAALAAWLGLDPGLALAVDGQLGRPTPELRLEDLLAAARSARPDLARAAARTRLRRSEIGLEEARGVSNLTVRAGLSYERLLIEEEAFRPRGLIHSIDDPQLILGVAVEIPLPIFDTNQGNIDRARALAAAAEAEEAALVRRITAQVAESHRRLMSARSSRERLRKEVMPRAERSLLILEEAYRLGARSLLDLLASRSAYLEAQEAELEAARAEEEALITLEKAVGVPLGEVLP